MVDSLFADGNAKATHDQAMQQSQQISGSRRMVLDLGLDRRKAQKPELVMVAELTFRDGCHSVFQERLAAVAIVILLSTCKDGSIWRPEVWLHLDVTAKAGRIRDNGVCVALCAALS